jgi:hypothetical protein
MLATDIFPTVTALTVLVFLTAIVLTVLYRCWSSLTSP